MGHWLMSAVITIVIIIACPKPSLSAFLLPSFIPFLENFAGLGRLT